MNKEILEVFNNLNVLIRKTGPVTFSNPGLIRSMPYYSTMVCDDLFPTMMRIKFRYDHKHTVSFHKTYWCSDDKACYHTHPHPMYVRILNGDYESNIGFGEYNPKFSVRSILKEGSFYSMEHKDLWHYHRPVRKTSSILTIEVEDTSIYFQNNGIPESKLNRELSEAEEKNLLSEIFVWSAKYFDENMQESLLFLNLDDVYSLVGKDNVNIVIKDGIKFREPYLGKFNVEVMDGKITKVDEV